MTTSSWLWLLVGMVVGGMIVGLVLRRVLDRREPFFATMLDTIEDRVCRFRTDDLVVTYCNEAWATAAGTTTDAAVGRPLDELVEAELIHGVGLLLELRSPEQPSGKAEIDRTLADGTKVRELWWDRLLVARDGHREILSVGRDITERAAVEDLLTKSEFQHRELIERLPLAAVVRRDHGIVFANQAAADLVGVTRPSALMGLDIADLILPTSMDVVEDRMRVEPEMGEVPPVLRIEGRRIDGQTRLVDLYTTAISFEGVRCTLAVVNDVTDLMRIQQDLERSERRFRTLVESAPVGIFETDPDGLATYLNPAWEQITGMSAADATGTGWREAIAPEDRDRVLGSWFAAASERADFASEIRYQRPDGTIATTKVASTTVTDEASTVIGNLGTVTDITAEAALRDALAASETRFRELADHSSDIVFRARISAAASVVEYVNPAFTAITGVPVADLLADITILGSRLTRPGERDLLREAILSPDSTPVRACIRRADGRVCWVDLRSTITRTANSELIVDGSARDITADVEAQQRLQQLAEVDPLTGLANRRSLLDALTERLDNRVPTSVLFLDLDGFKDVNDRAGHEAGDELLKQVAARLTRLSRNDDLVARLGGDEFVVLARPDYAAGVAERIHQHLAEPYALGDDDVPVTVSIGIATANETDGPGPVLDRADQAMYEAKRSRRPDDQTMGGDAAGG